MPPEFSKLKLLEWIRVFDNQITGTIPAEYSVLNPTLTQVCGRTDRVGGCSRSQAMAVLLT